MWTTAACSYDSFDTVWIRFRPVCLALCTVISSYCLLYLSRCFSAFIWRCLFWLAIWHPFYCVPFMHMLFSTCLFSWPATLVLMTDRAAHILSAGDAVFALFSVITSMSNDAIWIEYMWPYVWVSVFWWTWHHFISRIFPAYCLDNWFIAWTIGDCSSDWTTWLAVRGDFTSVFFN